MNFHHVKAFCTILAEGSFSGAAERLHLTQPTISAQIQSLERQLGARLFERSAQGISLTQAGEVFQPFALQMLELTDRAAEAVEALQGLARGYLTIAASTVPGHYLLPEALAAFKARRPGIAVSLAVSNSSEVRAAVREARVELGVVGERVADDRLKYVPLARDRLLAVVQPAHPLAEREHLAPSDLLDYPVVMREQGSATRSTLERALERCGVAPERLNVFLELGSAEALKAAIRVSDAVAVMSAWAVREEVRLGLLRALPIEGAELEREILLLWRAHGCLSSAAEAFISFLASEHLAGGSGSIPENERARPAGALVVDPARERQARAEKQSRQ